MPAYGYLFCILATAHAATFYVSTTGSDANAGTSPALAFRNPGRACSAIAVLRNPEGLLPSHVEVRILDGTYFLPGPLSIDAQCAGDGVHGVTWLADSGDVGRVRLSGGRPVGPWEPVPGYADVFSAVLSAAAYPQQFVRQLFAVDPQSGASTRRLLASTPVQQYANISYGARNATVTLPPGALGNATAAELSGAYVLLYHTWTTSVSPVTSWDPSTGVLSTSWTANTDFGSNSRYAVQNIADPGRLQPGTFFFDATSRVMTYRAAPGESVPAAMLVAPAMPEVLVCNASAAARALNVSFVNVSIVHAGAWVRKGSGADAGWSWRPLIPSPPPTPCSSFQLEEDCMVDGCSYQGAADSHLGAVHLHGAGSWTFQWVEVAHTGQYAVYVDDANDDVTLAGCYVHDTGMGGLRVGAATSGLLPDPAQLTAGVTVEDCTLADGGLLVAGGEGVMWQAAADGILEHNEVGAWRDWRVRRPRIAAPLPSAQIRDYSYTGVSVGWTWSYEATPVSGISVAYNHIYGIGNDVLSDLAGIYAVGPQPGGVFDHNLVHNVSCGGNGAHALYIDQVRKEGRVVHEG